MDQLIRNPAFLPTLLLACCTLILLVAVNLYFSTKLPKSTQETLVGSDVSIGLKREENATQSQGSTDGKTLNPATFKKFALIKSTQVSHNTKLLRFEIPSCKSLELPIGRHVSIRSEVDGLNVTRAYTPTSRPDQQGYFEILVKTYQNGKLSPFLHSLKIGQTIDVRGPVGRFKYEKNQFSSIGLIAGGTGITPCLQFIRSLLFCPEFKDDQTKLVLFFQNRSEEDLLLQEELEEIQRTFPSRVRMLFFLTNPPQTHWGDREGETTKEQGKGKGKVKGILKSSPRELCGYITKSHLKEGMDMGERGDQERSTTTSSSSLPSQIDTNHHHHPPPQQSPSPSPLSSHFFGVCGPSGFNDKMQGQLREMGYEEKQIFIW